MQAEVIEIKGKSKAQVQKRLFTVKEAAQYLGRSAYSMRSLIWSGKIPYIKNGEGGKIWVDRFDLDEWIEKNKTTYEPPPGKHKK